MKLCLVQKELAPENRAGIYGDVLISNYFPQGADPASLNIQYSMHITRASCTEL